MRAWLVVVALCAIGLAGCSDSDKGTRVASEPGKVTELTNVDTPKTAFSADDRKPRLLSRSVADLKRLSERRP